MNSFRQMTDDIFSNCIPVIEENEYTQRLMHPEYKDDITEIKSFPEKHPAELFFLGWELKDDRLRAFSLSGGDITALSYELNSKKTQRHTHNYLELAYVLEGEFCQSIQGKDVLFCKGECCLIDTNCTHQDYLQGQSAKVIFLGISNHVFHKVLHENIPEGLLAEFFGTALLSQKEIKQYLHLKPKQASNDCIEEILRNLFYEMVHSDVGFEYVCRGLIKRLLWHLCLAYDFSLSKEQAKEKNVLIADEVLRYIKDHLEEVTIQDLVKKFHYNEDYFNRLLKRLEGVTYSAYLQQLRIEKARELLEDTSLSIDEIIEQCGYHNKGFFYRIFAEKFGMTPAKLRYLNKKEID